MKVITLCGSTKFKKEFNMMNEMLTLDGNIVFSVGVFGHADGIQLSETQKIKLDIIHKRKILMSDSIYVMNVGGYIGSSTKEEIEFAKVCNIKVEYYENV